MVATARNGRDYLLQDLLPTIQDDKLWEMITRDLLEQRDRSHIWRLEVRDRFAELTEDELDDNCCNWTLAGTQWLQQIALDIRFATSHFKPDEWDPHILKDFMNLLALTLKSFQGQQECLGKVKKHCHNLKISDQAVVGDPQAIAREFDEWRTFVNHNLQRLVGSLSYNEHKKWDKHNQRINLQDGDKVPGATFTELLIQNGIQRQRTKIGSRPMKITQQDTEHVSGVNFKDATEVSSDIVKNFENVYQKTKADLEEVITKKGLKYTYSQHWHSRTIAVVADADTGIIVTGTTKPVAPTIPIFEEVADNICRIRVGEDFAP